MDDIHKPKKQLIDELQELRRQVNSLRAREIHLEDTRTHLQLTLHDLQVHQEELRVQNEELRLAREEAEFSRTKYLHLFDFAPVGYFTLGPNTQIQEVNLTSTEMLGYGRSYLLGKPLFLYVALKQREALAAHFRQVFSGQEAAIEVTFVRQDGQTIPVVLQSTLIQNASASEYLCLTAAIDITERVEAEATLREGRDQLKKTLVELKETQEKMMQRERLAAVGQLAAGIAHDFNNILTSILGFAELMQLSPDTPGAMRSDLQKLIASAQRAAHLVRQLLDFSRKTIQQKRQFNLTPFAKEVIRFLERTIPENIRLVLEIAPEDYIIEADPIQIQQLITNLVLNSRDAMPGGGNLRFGLSRVKGGPEIKCVLCDKPIEGDWLQVQIVDSGSGIAPDIMPHIFEPFFTTKEVGKGSGLGLSQVSGIILQHNGHLVIESQAGQETIFTVYLPLPILSQSGTKTSPVQTIKGQREAILLVEDEQVVLEVCQATLEYLNYQVITAKNGREAISKYKENAEKIILVLSDLVMPDIDGEALFHCLRAENPNLRMIIMSGYPLDEKGAKLLEQGIVSWFEKPISSGRLSEVLAKALSD